jgi:putative SOS response-associated peptidase YedK
MCGRYSLLCIDDLGNRFRMHNPMIGARSRFNIAPGNEVPVITRADGDTRITAMRWGLVPHQTDVLEHAPEPINARAETLAEKPLFRHLFGSRRCM